MKRTTVLSGLVLLAVAGGAAFMLLTATRPFPASSLPVRTANLANGETMFNIGGCASCHATPKREMTDAERRQLGGGLALNTPFGVFKVPNISSDTKNGLGGWTEAQFVNAMHNGVGRNGEHLYPAFPYTSYQRMRLDDVRDLYAFLKTLPAVDKPSEPHQLSFPFSVRRGLGLWKLVFLDGKEFQPAPGASPELNRGDYLVNGPGHCAECHSTRNLAGAIEPSKRFAGGPNPDGKGWIPNITPSPDGLAKWSDKDISYMLETGITPDGDSVGGEMADVAINTGKLTAADRNAMALYLKSLPARPGKAPPKKGS